MKETGHIVDVPCGRCTACRVARAREWASRLIHEMEYHEYSVFVTLTYDDEHLPENQSLTKSELQNYFKRLRKDLDYEHRKIKYFACGEYGDKNKRPHYHAIIFGMSLKNHDKDLIQDNWNKGFTYCGTVTFDSCRYVTSYVLKKYNGDKLIQEYGNRESPYCLMSKGIARKFVLDNSEYLYTNLGFTIKGEKCGLPRYYKNILKIQPQEYIQGLLENIKKERIEFEKRGIGVEGWSKAKAEKRRYQEIKLDAKIKTFTKGKC